MTDFQPKESNSVSPYLSLKDAAKAIDFYREVLGAKDEFRLDRPDGKVAHASMRIGDSQIMLGEEMSAQGEDFGVTRCSTYVYLADPDAALKKAKAKGAKILMEPGDMFYGDRIACFVDPFGQQWTVAKHIEDVSADELKRRSDEMYSKAA